MEILIQLGNGTEVPGSQPLVIIGANGVGKTRFGANLVSQFGYDRIPALRGLSLGGIPMWTPDQAKQEMTNAINSARSNTTDPAGDVVHLFAELKADAADQAEKFRKRALETGGNAGIPPQTKIEKLSDLWGVIFPGRTLDLESYNPRARWNVTSRSTDHYPTNQMSDGERSALYLAARVLQSPGNVIIVDEPEVHFHSLLARQFWDVVERSRPDCRFIYITHDLTFAQSRRGRIAIVNEPTRAELLPEDAPIPPDLYESILGAASLSVVANRIVFCEGLPGASIDVEFYGAWFRAPDTVVVPVGSCDAVRRTYDAFRSSSVVANLNPIAIVERDYWPQTYLERLEAEGMWILSTHELEGLLCLRGIAQAVAAHLACVNFEQTYTEFEVSARQCFSGLRRNKLILERAKREIDTRILGLANRSIPDTDLANTRASFVSTVDLGREVPDVGAIFDQQATEVNVVIEQGANKFLKILPGKDCLAILCTKLGVTKEKYLQLVIEALHQPENGAKDSFEALRDGIVSTITPLLPPRQ